jgi:hypothetical protein
MVKDEAQCLFDDAHDRPLSAKEVELLKLPYCKSPAGSGRWLYTTPYKRHRDEMVDRLVGRGLMYEVTDEVVHAPSGPWSWKLIKSPTRPKVAGRLLRLVALTELGQQELAKAVGP